MKTIEISRKAFLWFLALGFVLRILYSSISFHLGDLGSWESLGEFIFRYHISPFIWWAQGPFDAIPVMAFQGLNYLGFTSPYLLSIFEHIPFIFGDALLTLISFFVLRDYFPKNKFIYTTIIWFNCLLIFISSVWGQTDVWMIACTILSLYFFSKEDIWLGAIALGCAASFKYVPLAILPALLVFYWKPRDLIKIFIGTFSIFIGSFIFVYLLNLLIYHDPYFFSYFLDRSGTIFGRFTPNLDGGTFISTGSALWGELYMLHIYTTQALTPWKSLWLPIYTTFYLVFSIWVLTLGYRNRTKISQPREKFIFLNIFYAAILIPFMLLYPQSQLQRFINFMIPLQFVFFYFEWDLVLLGIVNILTVIANDIYAAGSLFHLSGKNILITTTLLAILFSSSLVFLINSRRQFYIAVLTLLVFISLYYFNNSGLHPLLTLVNYLALLTLSFVSIVAFFKSQRYVVS